MDMKQLKCFVAAAETGNFTRASAQLNTAQSALSRNISNLEAELGLQLFIRAGRGVQLSPEGIIAYDKAKKLLSDFRAFSRDSVSTEHRPATRRVALAAHGGMGPCFLPYVAKLLSRSDEHIQFRLSEEFSEQIERNVCSGEADIGLVLRRSGFRVERSDLETITLVDDELYAINAADDPSVIGEAWPAHLALNYPLILAPTGSRERASVENWARQQNIILNVVGEAASFPTRIQMGRDLGAILILPRIGLADLITRGHWKAHPIAPDDYYLGIQWFVIYRRSDGDRLIRGIVEVIRREALILSDRSRELLA
jgi:LysR family nitrogen assimilation transcriptional regulator